jgi:hypothetical protein
MPEMSGKGVGNWYRRAASLEPVSAADGTSPALPAGGL